MESKLIVSICIIRQRLIDYEIHVSLYSNSLNKIIFRFIFESILIISSKKKKNEDIRKAANLR